MVELTKNYSQQKKQTIKQIQTQNKLFPYWTSTILEWSRRLKRARVFTYSLFSCSADIYPVFVYTFQNQRSVNSMILLLRDFFIVLTFVVLVFYAAYMRIVTLRRLRTNEQWFIRGQFLHRVATVLYWSYLFINQGAVRLHANFGGKYGSSVVWESIWHIQRCFQ